MPSAVERVVLNALQDLRPLSMKRLGDKPLHLDLMSALHP